MKKILMGTSAAALVGGVATSANAATWDLDWGGYYETMAAYSSTDNAGPQDYDGFDLLQDAEVNFTPSITLDNGLSFGANVQLEANSRNDSSVDFVNNTASFDDIIDESYVFVTGSFGRLDLGSENSAGYKMMVGAPDVSWIGVNSGSLTGLIQGLGAGNGFRRAYGSGFTEVDGNNDAVRATYYTPRFSGFQMGVSYARDENENYYSRDDVNAGTGNLHDIFDVGLNYTNSFGGFDVSAGARYGTGTREVAGGADPDTWGVGLNLGHSGITIGGSYAKSDNDQAGLASRDETFYDAGISYETGPWGVSFTYSNSDRENSADDASLDQYLAAVSYAFGPGVTLGAVAGYADYAAPAVANAAGLGTGAADADGWTIGTGFNLGF